MSEQLSQNPEASTQTVIEVYQKAADYLETAIHFGIATREPALYTQFAMLTVKAEVPELSGKKILLEYDRPADDEDMTQVDRDIPLAWNDETGRNHWQTPIRIAVQNVDGRIQHDYFVEYIGEDDWARVVDDKLQPGQEVDEYGGLTQLDANEIIAHLEWGLENLQP